MRFLASFVMRGRSQAVMAAAVLAILSLLIPPVSIISSAVIALVTLRRGGREGLAVGALAAVASGLLALLIFSNTAPAIAFWLLLWLPAFLLALVLRATQSLRLMVETALAIGVLVIGIDYVQVADPVAGWRELLEPMSHELVSGGLLDDSNRALFVTELARWMTGLLAAGFFLQLVVSLFLGRGWQAMLYNPGGFRDEFHALRLHRALGGVALGLILLAVLGWSAQHGWVRDFGILLASALLLQGLAVTHAVAASRKIHSGWLVGLYVLLLFAMVQISILLVTVGLMDMWVDFRARLGSRET